MNLAQKTCLWCPLFHACVGVFAMFGSVLSVGDGILFVLVMSAAARSHGPASIQGSSLFDSCAQAASVNSV